MLRIGIECENIEDPKSRWGVGQLTLNLLKEYESNPEWQQKYKLYLYFKKRVPDDEFLKNPIFVKRVLGFPSFNIFYHILMPLRAMADRLDWMFFPAYMLPPLYFGKSVVMLTEDVYYEYKSGILPFRYRLAYGLFTNWAAIMATKILAISETSKREIAKVYRINPERIFVSYLGISTSQSVQSVIRNPELSNYLLYVGQAFPRRHLKETILAFKEIVSEFPDLKLIAVGKDKYQVPIIKDLVKKINQESGAEKIKYHDYLENREEIDNLYSGAKALVYVSDREAFGLPPMEASSFGVPPVIMDNELGHELFSEYAFYSKSGNAHDIAEAIKSALNNESKTLNIRNNGPEFVKKYNWKDFSARFFNEIK
ncbi:MAG: glycosyltransferase [Candidatus Yanofskybacteria bacterium]|nr:glycosyltransferase [Candidatus Yanofskybacteria bacterium]